MKPREETVLVISADHDSASEVAERLRGSPEITQRVSLVEVPSAEKRPAVRHGAAPCAAVILFEPTGLVDGRFRECVATCIKRVAAREDFRLFALTRGMTRAELLRSTDALIQDLTDVVQIPVAADDAEVLSALDSYLTGLRTIRGRIAYRRLRTRFISLAGRFAMVVQIACLPVVLVELVSRLVSRLASGVLTGLPISSGSSGVSAVAVGTLVFPALAPLIYAATAFGPLAALATPRGRQWYLLSFVAFSALAAVARPTAPSSPWLVLGLVAGVLVDHVRRVGRQGRRVRLSMDWVQSTPSGSDLPKRVSAGARESLALPLMCPINTTNEPNIFISYSTRSNWGTSACQALASMLRGLNAVYFRDAEHIPHGSSWRAVLNSRVAVATTLISITDPESAASRWPAAEMETALAGRQLTGRPEIIVLIPPEPFVTDARVLPVYKEVLARSSDVPAAMGDAVSVVRLRENTLRNLTSQLQPYVYHAPGLLPSGLTALMTLGALFLGTLGFIGGWLGQYGIAFVAVLPVSRTARALLPGGASAIAILLASAYALGFCLRLIAAYAYEVNIEDSRKQRWRNALSVVGWASIGAVAFGQTQSGYFLAWAVVAAILAFLMAESWVSRVGRKDPEFLRSPS